MNPGKIAAVLYDAVAWFFIISFVVFPILYRRWRRRERVDAAATQRILRLLKTDTRMDHGQDAI